jgi:hypothetical protein
MDESTLNQKQAEDCEILVDQNSSTFVMVAAQHVDSFKNYLNKVPCKKGVPLVGHVYDSKHDCYFLPCVDFLLLGSVRAAAYVASRTNKWNIRVPLAVPVMMQFLDDNQRRELKHFLDSFNPEFHKFQYLQMIDPNECNPPIKH